MKFIVTYHAAGGSIAKKSFTANSTTEARNIVKATMKQSGYTDANLYDDSEQFIASATRDFRNRVRFW